uniref:Uncharacterized protein n=1 Tax=Arundo donax TaxID=35708 RepID=A0A0A9A771_ARUDO
MDHFWSSMPNRQMHGQCHLSELMNTLHRRSSEGRGTEAQ